MFIVHQPLRDHADKSHSRSQSVVPLKVAVPSAEPSTILLRQGFLPMNGAIAKISQPASSSWHEEATKPSWLFGLQNGTALLTAPPESTGAASILVLYHQPKSSALCIPKIPLPCIRQAAPAQQRRWPTYDLALLQ